MQCGLDRSTPPGPRGVGLKFISPDPSCPPAPFSPPLSRRLNLDGLLERIWDMMALVRGGGGGFMGECGRVGSVEPLERIRDMMALVSAVQLEGGGGAASP